MTFKQVVVDSLYYTLIIFCLTICTICFIAAVCELVMTIYSDIHNKYKGDTKTVTEIDDEIKELIEEADKKEQEKINTVGKRLFLKKFKKYITSGSVRFYNNDGAFKPWSYAYKYACQNRNEITKYDCYFEKHKDEYITFYLGEDPAITGIREARENRYAFEEKHLRSDGYID